MDTLLTLPQRRSGPMSIWLLHAANLLYLLIVLSSWLLAGGAGSAQGPPPAWLDPGIAAIVAQVSLILLPALAFIWLTRQPVRSTLKLNPLSLGVAARCLLVGLLSWAGFVFFSNLTTALLASVQPGAVSQATDVVSRGGAPWAILIVLVVVAPLCEEILFRGVVLSAYEERVGLHAIWLVALLFATVHLSVDQILGALFIGLIAGWVVYRTRSLWAGVLVHAGTNLVSALLVLLALAAPGAVEEAAQAAAPSGDPISMLWIGALVWGGVALVMLAPMFFLLRSIGRRHPAPIQAEAHLDLQTLWSFVLVLVASVGYIIYDLFH